MRKFLTNASLPLDILFLHAPNPLFASECENIFFFGRVNVLVSTYFWSLFSVPTSLCFHWSTIFLISVSDDNLRAKRNETKRKNGGIIIGSNLDCCEKMLRPWNVYFNAINCCAGAPTHYRAYRNSAEKSAFFFFCRSFRFG